MRESLVLDSAAGVFALRAGDWKLIERNESLTAATKAKQTKADLENQNQLYNLAEDPAESKNLWADWPDLVKRLSELLAKAKQDNRTRP